MGGLRLKQTLVDALDLKEDISRIQQVRETPRRVFQTVITDYSVPAREFVTKLGVAV